jgi:hypothetical protein
MSEFVYQSEDTSLLYEALSGFDNKELSLEPDKQGNRGHKYISKGVILEKTRRVLNEFGLRFMRTTQTINDKQYIVHELRHVKSGQFIRSAHFYNDMTKQLDNAGIQTLGGLRTYIARYEIADMLYIDDCGPDPDELITKEHYENIVAKTGNDPDLLKKICSHYKISDIKFLFYSRYEEVITKLNNTKV